MRSGRRLASSASNADAPRDGLAGAGAAARGPGRQRVEQLRGHDRPAQIGARRARSARRRLARRACVTSTSRQAAVQARGWLPEARSRPTARHAASMIATSTGPRLRPVQRLARGCRQRSAPSATTGPAGSGSAGWSRRRGPRSGPRPRSSGTTARRPGRAVAAACGSRSVKWNVVPTPGSLSSQIRPPISSQSRLLIARPRPVPP